MVRFIPATIYGGGNYMSLHQQKMYERRTVVTLLNDELTHVREQAKDEKGYFWENRLSVLEMIAKWLKTRKIGNVKRIKLPKTAPASVQVSSSFRKIRQR